jgi:hypothetical protein
VATQILLGWLATHHLPNVLAKSVDEATFWSMILMRPESVVNDTFTSALYLYWQHLMNWITVHDQYEDEEIE